MERAEARERIIARKANNIADSVRQLRDDATTLSFGQDALADRIEALAQDIERLAREDWLMLDPVAR